MSSAEFSMEMDMRFHAEMGLTALAAVVAVVSVCLSRYKLHRSGTAGEESFTVSPAYRRILNVVAFAFAARLAVLVISARMESQAPDWYRGANYARLRTNKDQLLVNNSFYFAYWFSFELVSTGFMILLAPDISSSWSINYGLVISALYSFLMTSLTTTLAFNSSQLHFSESVTNTLDAIFLFVPVVGALGLLLCPRKLFRVRSAIKPYAVFTIVWRTIECTATLAGVEQSIIGVCISWWRSLGVPVIVYVTLATDSRSLRNILRKAAKQVHESVGKRSVRGGSVDEVMLHPRFAAASSRQLSSPPRIARPDLETAASPIRPHGGTARYHVPTRSGPRKAAEREEDNDEMELDDADGMRDLSSVWWTCVRFCACWDRDSGVYRMQSGLSEAELPSRSRGTLRDPLLDGSDSNDGRRWRAQVASSASSAEYNTFPRERDAAEPLSLPEDLFIPPEDVDLGRHLGRGANCDVYTAVIWRGTSRWKVAVKVFDIRLLLQIESRRTSTRDEAAKAACAPIFIEAQTAEKFSHKYIVKFYCVAIDLAECRAMMVFELCKKGSLKKYLRSFRRSGKRLPHRRVVKFAIQCARAIRYLHRRRTMHGDIKSANFLIKENREVRLGDFGLTKEIASMTQQRRIIEGATPEYAPPEVLQFHEGDLPFDVYAFGMVMWELWSYELPFNGWTRDAMESYVVDDGGRPNTTCVELESMRELIEECWRQRAEDRPTINQVLQRLYAIQREICDGTSGDSGDASDVSAEVPTDEEEDNEALEDV